jgi:hypothetical protein
MGRERAPDDSTDPTRLGNSDSTNKQGAAGITTAAVQFRGCPLSFVGELLSTC